jgi:hypothetical protein
MLTLVTALVTVKAGKLSNANVTEDILRESMTGSKNVAMARDLDSGIDSDSDSMSLDDAIGLESAGVDYKIRVKANLAKSNVMLAQEKLEMASARSPTKLDAKNFKILAGLSKAERKARRKAAKAKY